MERREYVYTRRPLGSWLSSYLSEINKVHPPGTNIRKGLWMSHVAVCFYVFRSRNIMAHETRRGRSADQSRSGRAVIWVQIISWCAVGALLILRGVTTLTNDDTSSSTDYMTTSMLVTSRDSNGTKSSRETDEYVGTAEGETFAENNSTSTEAKKTIRGLSKGSKLNPTSAILITVGATMLVIGPTLLLARVFDTRRHSRQAVKFSKVDPPPSYEDVVDKAPRYSTLFQVTEDGDVVPIANHSNSTSTSVPV